MAAEYTLGTYRYQCKIREDQLTKLPDQLKMGSISSCGVLLELVMGKMRILDCHGEKLYDQSFLHSI